MQAHIAEEIAWKDRFSSLSSLCTCWNKQRLLRNTSYNSTENVSFMRKQMNNCWCCVYGRTRHCWGRWQRGCFQSRSLLVPPGWQNPAQYFCQSSSQTSRRPWTHPEETLSARYDRHGSAVFSPPELSNLWMKARQRCVLKAGPRQNYYTIYMMHTHRIFTHITISLFQLAKVFAHRVPGICWVRVSPSYMNISLKA